MSDVTMNYDSMRKMVNAFEETVKLLASLYLNQAMILAHRDTSLVLQGRAGGRFYVRLEDILMAETNKLLNLVGDIADDVDGARRALEEGDIFAAGRFH